MKSLLYTNRKHFISRGLNIFHLRIIVCFEEPVGLVVIVAINILKSFFCFSPQIVAAL